MVMTRGPCRGLMMMAAIILHISMLAAGKMVVAVDPPSPELPGTPAGCTATSCDFFYLCDEQLRQPGATEATHCGQVDAAPAIPPSLFKPEHSLELSLYIKFAEGVQMQDPFCGGAENGGNPKLGSCASQGYKYKHANEPGRRIAWAGYPHGSIPDFGPSVVFEKACFAGCGCCANTSTQADPGSLPGCKAGERKSYRVGPKAARWPKFLTANPYSRPQVGPTSGPIL